jgi:hypothetical protein
MAHAKGTRLNGVHDLASLRSRCVCRPGDDCWHYRSARGKPPPKGRTMRVWSTRHGASMSVRKLAVLLSGRAMADDACAVATCDGEHCVNPGHLIVLPRPKMLKRMQALGKWSTVRMTIANRIAGRRRSRLSQAARAEIAASPLSAVKLGRIHGISPSWISELRKRARRAVLTTWGPAP